MIQGAYVRLNHETVVIEVESKTAKQVPLHHLGGIVIMGNVMISPFLMAKCAEEGRAVVVLDRNGRFKARVVGKTTGNVLLRLAQFTAMQDKEKCAGIARAIIAGKIKNSREIVMRCARESDSDKDKESLVKAAQSLKNVLHDIRDCSDLDRLRGFEGEAANTYFDVLELMVSGDLRETFQFPSRNRRPPRDPMNALLSFLYTLLLSDCVSGLEGVGLDSQVGYLHALRPGRPSLGLDLMEELRPVLGDRLALTLINRKQISGQHFEHRIGGAVYLNEAGRKLVIGAYQRRKQDEFQHLLLREKIPFGLVPHIQARLLARHLRGDLEAYPPVIYGG